MKRDTVRPPDNRAVTPFFRVFGGRRRDPVGEAVRVADVAAMHRFEWIVLSLLVPMVLGVALFDGLWRLGGPWLAWLGILPALFLALHALAFGLGRRSPGTAFWCWGILLGAWSLWSVGAASGAVSSAGWLWLSFLALQALAAVFLGWRWLMSIAGTPGMVLRVSLIVVAHLLMLLSGWQFGWAWAFCAGAGAAGLWAWGTFRPESSFFGPMATRVEGKGVLLTIDDGPDPGDTRQVLDLLDRFGAKAVFFVIGDKVRESPELAREIVKRGHELGNHTMTHPQASMWCAGPARTCREIRDCQQVVEEVTGEVPRWFRAPVGHRNFFTHPVTRSLDLEVVAWTRRAFDTVETDVERMVTRLTYEVGDGDVLLLHQGAPVSVELLTRVLERLEASGLLQNDQVIVEGGAAPER